MMQRRNSPPTNDPAEAEPKIHGDRRTDRRYPLELDLRYKLLRRKRVVDTGAGRTVDISSGGIRFETDHALPAKCSVELSISWPVLLHNVAPMQLVATGRIVRNEGNSISVRMDQHEFRTQGTRENYGIRPAYQKASMTANRVQPALFASIPTVAVSGKIQ